MGDLRIIKASAQTTGMFGRVMTSVRGQHFLLDASGGRDGVPSECPNAGEVFLQSLAGCGTVIVESAARKRDIRLDSLRLTVESAKQKEHPELYTWIRIGFRLAGPTQAEAEELVGVFQAECPIYRLAKLGSTVSVEVVAEPARP